MSLQVDEPDEYMSTNPDDHPDGVVPLRRPAPRGPVGVTAVVTNEYDGPMSREREVAEEFVLTYADTMRYVYGLGWHVWNGHRWADDENGVAERGAMHVIRTSLREAVDIEDADKRKAVMKALLKLDKSSGIAGTLAMARAMLPIATSHTALDADPWLLNTPTQTINLRTGDVGPPNPRDLITKATGVEVAPAGTPSPTWDAFLDRVLPNKAVRGYVQRVLGSALLGKVQTQNLPIWTGSGANGKGTLRDAVKYALGSYCIEVDPDLLMSTNADKHPTELMDLMGARLVFCSETNEGRKFNAARMKRLTGGDPIRARRIGRDPIEFDPSHQLVMLTNRALPNVSANDPAVWRRIQATPWDVVIPPAERDVELGDKLQREAEQILRWVVDGWLDYRKRNGLDVPSEVAGRTAQYRAANDVVGQFIDERCTPREEFRASSSELFRAFKDWAHDNGFDPGNANQFAEAMEAEGYRKKREKGGVKWLGLRIDAEHWPSKVPPPEAP